MAKYALVSMMGNVGGTLLNTQGSGYYTILKKMIHDYFPEDQIDYNPIPNLWSDYDTLFICESVNFTENSFNIPGGVQDSHIEKMRAISDYKGVVKFINKHFDFEGFNKRLKIPDLKFPEGPVIDLFKSVGEDTRKCVIGDSHALSVWRPGWGLDFTPGRTLHGFLKRNTPESINEKYDSVILYFSNIDLRFHLMRQETPIVSTIKLFTDYVNFAKQLKNVSIVEPLPVEHESRKIPGTGLYKKQPFFGSRTERMNIREIALEVLHGSGLDIINWPSDWIDSDGTKMLDILESKQSVHLKPKNYPHISEIIS